MPILLHTTQIIYNKLPYSYLAECNVTSNTTLHYTAFLINTRYKYESVSVSLEEQKEFELSLIWIRSESHVNLNRAPRKLYLSPKPIRNETYFKSKWSQFQSQKSLFALQHKQNREGCVMNKSPFLAISHAYYLFSYQKLSRFYQKIVMGDRWFAKKSSFTKDSPSKPI